jgi:hypothetical protein
MAASRPARSLLQKIRVIDVSDENVPGYLLLLEVTFQTKRRVAFIQQTLVNRPMRRMADRATLTECLVLIHKWAALLRVTLEARFVSAQESKTASFKLLLNIRRRTLDRDPLVQFVTIGAAHLAFRYRMMVWQLERRANFQVTLETRFRRFSRIYDCASSAAGFHVQTPRPVARFTAHVRDLFWSFAALCAALTYDHLFCLQSGVGGCSEIAHDLFVARCAFLRADELRTGNAGRSKDCSTGGAAGKQNYRQRGSSSGTP